ncbi:unnamed protein product [Schistosoma mattheei]|uniref:Uncharacterized protein n=1 Tax=Schistosoma mattheei TaxID=31246 RepID=A0A183NMU4_9TREM|nr:unnamed protein product [Schistosoma mattheei]
MIITSSATNNRVVATMSSICLICLLIILNRLVYIILSRNIQVIFEESLVI